MQNDSGWKGYNPELNQKPQQARLAWRFVAKLLLIVIPILLLPLALVKITLVALFVFCAESILHKLEELLDGDTD